MRRSWTIGLFLVALTAPLRAQEPESSTPDTLALPRWLVTVYAGSFGIADDELEDVGMTSEAGAIVGARLGYRFADSWMIEGSWGTASLDATSEGFGAVDGRMHLYHGALVFLAPETGRAQIALSAGAGGIRYAYDEFERRGVLLQDESWAHELVVPLGAGLVVNLGAHAGIRLEARDVIQFCSAETEPIDETTDFSHCPLDDSVLHNPEFSGGLLLRF